MGFGLSSCTFASTPTLREHGVSRVWALGLVPLPLVPHLPAAALLPLPLLLEVAHFRPGEGEDSDFGTLGEFCPFPGGPVFLPPPDLHVCLMLRRPQIKARVAAAEQTAPHPPAKGGGSSLPTAAVTKVWKGSDCLRSWLPQRFRLNWWPVFLPPLSSRPGVAGCPLPLFVWRTIARGRRGERLGRGAAPESAGLDSPDLERRPPLSFIRFSPLPFSPGRVPWSPPCHRGHSLRRGAVAVRATFSFCVGEHRVAFAPPFKPKHPIVFLFPLDPHALFDWLTGCSQDPCRAEGPRPGPPLRGRLGRRVSRLSRVCERHRREAAWHGAIQEDDGRPRLCW